MPLLNKIGVLFPSLKSLAAAVMLLTQEDRDLDGDTLRYQAELQCWCGVQWAERSTIPKQEYHQNTFRNSPEGGESVKAQIVKEIQDLANLL